MFLLHNDISSMISIHHWCCFVLHDSDAWTVDFEQVIISVTLLTVLFPNLIMICSRSAANVSPVLRCLLSPSALAAEFENRSLFWLFVSWLFVSPALLAKQTDLFHIRRTCVTGFISFAFTVCWLTLNRSLIRFYYTWYFLLTKH